jgi:hypothetical protein
MYKVIGITGYKGHGKDYFAKHIQKLYPQFEIIHFARRLKQICSQVFDLPEEEFESGTLKERIYNKNIEIDNYINNLSNISGINILPRGLTATSHRTLLQYVGTEYIRSIETNYWVDYLINYITKNPRNYLIPDMRFINEAKALNKINASIAMVHRPEIETPKDTHISERPDLLKPYVNLHVITKTGDQVTLDIAAQVAFEMSRDTKITVTSTGYDDYGI